MAVVHQHAPAHVLLVVLEYSGVPRELPEVSRAGNVGGRLDPGQHAARVSAAAGVWWVYRPLGGQRVAATHVGSPAARRTWSVAECTLQIHKKAQHNQNHSKPLLR